MGSTTLTHTHTEGNKTEETVGKNMTWKGKLSKVKKKMIADWREGNGARGGGGGNRKAGEGLQGVK